MSAEKAGSERQPAEQKQGADVGIANGFQLVQVPKRLGYIDHPSTLERTIKFMRKKYMQTPGHEDVMNLAIFYCGNPDGFTQLQRTAARAYNAQPERRVRVVAVRSEPF